MTSERLNSSAEPSNSSVDAIKSRNDEPILADDQNNTAHIMNHQFRTNTGRTPRCFVKARWESNRFQTAHFLRYYLIIFP